MLSCGGGGGGWGDQWNVSRFLLLFLFRLFCLYENALYGLTHMLMNKINCKQLTLATICLNPRHKLTFKNYHHLRTKSINYFWCVEHRFFFYFCSNLCLLQGLRKSTTKLTKSLTRWWKRTYFIQWVVIIAFCIVSFTLALLSAAVFSTLFLLHLPPSRRGEFV